MEISSNHDHEPTRSTSTSRRWSYNFTTSIRLAPVVSNALGGGRRGGDTSEEEDLRWAAIERLPTYERIRRSVLTQILENGQVKSTEVDVKKLDEDVKKLLKDRIIKVVEEDNERLLRMFRDRIDRVGIEIPKIEIRYENLGVEGHLYSGSRALPSLFNVTLNTIEGLLSFVHLFPSKKRKIKILKEVSGIVKPSRMTLLLGPPGAGKTTLLLSLADKLDRSLRKSGRITYCGHEFKEFVPQRTCAYISQHDLHHGEMTVRETLDFSGCCFGIGTRYDLLAELSRREKTAGIKPDPEIDAFMKAVSIPGQNSSLVTDYVLKLLGLDICADILVGDNMRRGISGGQKKRLTTGEMLVGPAKVLLMDEISTGLDSSTTYQIMGYMRQIVHILDVTMIVALLQPAPETYDLFDDIVLLSEGHIVYQGPKEKVLVFFEHMGFKCPERKGVADFLQEVTSKKDQEQYWCNKNRPYRYMSAKDFSDAFKSFYLGRNLARELNVPYDKSRTHPAALVKHKYGISNRDLLRACFSREWLLMKRSSFVYIFKTAQLTVMAIISFSVFFRTNMPHGTLSDGRKYYGALFFTLVNAMFNGLAELALMIFRLPVFYKQRDYLFFPAWAFALPILFLRIPISFLESAIWCALTYYTIGFAPSAARFFKQFLALFCVHNMSLGLFRFIAAVARTQVMAFTQATFILLVVFILGGFIIAKNGLQPWMKWAYYASPMSYGQNAISINEFLAKRWASPNTDPRFDQPTVGKVLLSSRGFYTEEKWFWICILALVAFAILYNLLFIAALTFLNPPGGSNNQTLDGDDDTTEKNNVTDTGTYSSDSVNHIPQRGMVLPFEPLSLVFDRINYNVDMPTEMKPKGFEGDRLQLLHDVSGVFRPRVLTALVGVSGAGKTTLMDVLAGRKTGGYVEGEIKISGYPKNQTTFARISGYCEQNDIHSPFVTVYESVLYSAWLRLSREVNEETRKMFVEQVMQLVELDPLRNSIVGFPGENGLSTEQRKRLTIAVELVANPSIIFMDEPTSGLDARAAAIVMRTVRNTVDTGRTVVCTIHQPSIDIFETFDELLLMKRGGRVIYAGPLGHHSRELIEYFEGISGVPNITDGYNPATWMLDITTPAIENQLGVDFSDIYAHSSLYQSNQQLIKELSVPTADSKDLYFPTKYSQPFLNQCRACFWKQYWSYWRNTEYNAVRFLTAILIGVTFGIIFWNIGQKTSMEQDLQNLLGAIYSAVIFLGSANINPVQGVVAIERTVFYRERAAGMYSALAYAFSQVLIETIYVAIQTIVYTLIIYSMIGFKWTVGKFFLFYYFIFASFLYLVMYGMMLISLSPGVEISSIVSSFFLSMWNLFSGFLISRTQIPIWWRWYYWGSPNSWTLYGIITSQLGDLTSQVAVPGNGDMTVKAYLEQNLGYKHSFLPVVCVMHVAFIVLFGVIFAIAIKCINFQRR